MTNKHFTILAKYEKQLESAIVGNYCRLTSTEFNEVAGVYAEMYQRTVTQAERNCSSCKLRVVRTLAEAYFTDKGQREAVKDIATTVVEAPQNIKPAKVKKSK